jgi:hypothetical protein
MHGKTRKAHIILVEGVTASQGGHFFMELISSIILALAFRHL